VAVGLPDYACAAAQAMGSIVKTPRRFDGPICRRNPVQFMAAQRP